MRGKKTDSEFVSKFISDCIKQGTITPEAIVKIAKSELQVIDNKIKEVEQLKFNRSKLLDVVHAFEKPKGKEEEIKLLPFFLLEYPHICKELCDYLKEKPISIKNTLPGWLDPERTFCLKQLINSKIVSKVDNQIICGERFDEYMKFVLREIK